MVSENQTEGFRGERVGAWVSPVMSIKEGKYYMEHWVWCIKNESWNTEKIKLNFKKRNFKIYASICGNK